MIFGTTSLIVFLAFTAGASLVPALALDLHSSNQMPELIEQSSDSVSITNIGNSDLNISYKEGTPTNIQIPSGRTVKIPSQNIDLPVTFHNGNEIKSIMLKRGSRYALYWNSAIRRWDIALYDEVAKQRTPLRSQ